MVGPSPDKFTDFHRVERTILVPLRDECHGVRLVQRIIGIGGETQLWMERIEFGIACGSVAMT